MKTGNFRKGTFTESNASSCWTVKGISGYVNNPLPPSFSNVCQIPHILFLHLLLFFKCYSMYFSFRHSFLFKVSVSLISELFIFWLVFSPHFWCHLSSKSFFHSMRKNNFLFLLGKYSAPLPLCFLLKLKFFFS